MSSLLVHVLFARLEEHLTPHRMKHLCHSMAAHVVNAHLLCKQAGSPLVEKKVKRCSVEAPQHFPNPSAFRTS